MNRSIIKRLETLEERSPKDTGRTHVILVASDEEEERQTADLKASSKWIEGDDIFVIKLVAGEFPEGPNDLGDVDLPPALVASR